MNLQVSVQDASIHSKSIFHWRCNSLSDFATEYRFFNFREVMMSVANVQRYAVSSPVKIHLASNSSATAVQIRLELNQKFTRFNTAQRAIAVMILWQPEGTEDVDKIRVDINMMVNVLGGDDHYRSVRFALALEITFHAIDDLGLNAEHRDQLSGVLNAPGRDFETTGKDVCRIIGESRQASQPEAAEPAEEASTIPGPVPSCVPAQPPVLQQPEPVTARAPIINPHDPASVSGFERSSSKPENKEPTIKSRTSQASRNLRSVRQNVQSAANALSERITRSSKSVQEKREAKANALRAEAPASLVEEKPAPVVSEAASASLGQRAKNALSTMSARVRDGFASARDALSNRMGAHPEENVAKSGVPVIIEEDDGNLPPEEIRDLSFLDPRMPTAGEKIQDALSGAANRARKGWSSARVFLSESGRQAGSALRESASSLKDRLSVVGQRAEEAITDGLDAVNDARNGKTVARMKSSAGRVAKRSQKLAGSVVNGISRGARAAGGWLSKASHWVRDRRAEAQGFDRI